jgi:mannose-6-phosphate isomerase-like protein (cupin superfamily)
MDVRRVVTGHTAEGTAVVVSDEEVAMLPIGDRGSGTTLLWGRDDLPAFPDNGAGPVLSPDPYGPAASRFAVMELASEGDDFHEFVRRGMAAWSDPDHPGMHRTPTIDYDIVLEGTIGLELDGGVEVTLTPGDVVVQNGTRHRWHNRGNTTARLLAVAIGGRHEFQGGRSV